MLPDTHKAKTRQRELTGFEFVGNQINPPAHTQ
jgi:hypothetical protein